MQRELVKIGKVSRVHGLKGELCLQPDRFDGFQCMKGDMIFLEINGCPTPFFISAIRKAGANSVIGLDGIQSGEAAKKLTGCVVYAENKNERDTPVQFTDLEGYLVCDQQGNELGKVEQVITLPAQSLLSIRVKGKEILLPLHDDFVMGTDHENKIIRYKAPEGLFEI